MKLEPYDIKRDNEATDLYDCPYYKGYSNGVGYCKLVESSCAKELGEGCYDKEIED